MSANTPFTFADDEAQDFWEEFDRLHQNGPDAEIVAYAAALAAALEAAITQGRTVAEIWVPISDEIGTQYGMSGRTESFAVKLLARTWKYGEELRLANNAFWGHPEADGLAIGSIMTS